METPVTHDRHGAFGRFKQSHDIRSSFRHDFEAVQQGPGVPDMSSSVCPLFDAQTIFTVAFFLDSRSLVRLQLTSRFWVWW